MDGARGPTRRSWAKWWWVGLPVVPAQAIWLTKTIQRFPDADGEAGTAGTGTRRMKVVALGDSVTAGYALEHHRSSVAGKLAAGLAEQYDATVDWCVLAVSGYTAGQALDLVDPAVLADADLVFLSVGVNDLKDLHSAKRFKSELGRLLDAILGAAPDAQICLLGIPPLEHFPAFPNPLAQLLGRRGQVFNAVSRAEIDSRTRAFRIDADQPLAPEMFGPDGFHPSAALHSRFAEATLEKYSPLSV